MEANQSIVPKTAEGRREKLKKLRKQDDVNIIKHIASMRESK